MAGYSFCYRDQDVIPEPVIEKHDTPNQSVPPEVNPMVADLMTRGEELEAEHQKQRTKEADYSLLRKNLFGI